MSFLLRIKTVLMTCMSRLNMLNKEREIVSRIIYSLLRLIYILSKAFDWLPQQLRRQPIRDVTKKMFAYLHLSDLLQELHPCHRTPPLCLVGPSLQECTWQALHLGKVKERSGKTCFRLQATRFCKSSLNYLVFVLGSSILGQFVFHTVSRLCVRHMQIPGL